MQVTKHRNHEFDMLVLSIVIEALLRRSYY
nr:MAG TPA: hypothetical protein [Caudoviricetes sp.]